MAAYSSSITSLLLLFLVSPVICSGGEITNGQWKRLITVKQSGGADFRTIQDAINSVSLDNKDGVFIRVEPGVYKEQVVVPADKPHIFLSGRDAKTTVIEFGAAGTIHTSATFTVFASNFTARYLTFQNTRGPGVRAVALRVETTGMAEFYACRMVGYQDTLLAESGIQNYYNCYIEGVVDFIFGDASATFKDCHIHSTSTGNYAAITAQRRTSEGDDTGFYFVRGRVTCVKNCILGRPWGPFSRVVFAYTYMSSGVSPRGWDNWGNPKLERTVYYGEYRCSGPGANRSGRVTWSRSLNKDDMTPLLSNDKMKKKQRIKA